MLPDNFSPSEHLQDAIKKIYNRAVREYFQDLGGDDWSPDIDTPRASLRTACQHFDADSFLMTLGRMLVFDLAVNQRLVGMPGFEEGGKGIYRKQKPQIILYFQEDNEDIAEGYEPVTGRISFRLMSHDSESITPAIAMGYATEIKSAFGNGGGFVWRKGKLMCSYTHWEKGYQMQLLCRAESDATELISKVLGIQDDSPQWEYMNKSENQAESIAYPTMPGQQFVFGETRKIARKRPIADVRFQYAIMRIEGMLNPVCLVDRSGTWPQPLVDV